MNKKYVIASTRGFLQYDLSQSGMAWTGNFSRAQRFDRFNDAWDMAEKAKTTEHVFSATHVEITE